MTRLSRELQLTLQAAFREAAMRRHVRSVREDQLSALGRAS